MAEPTHTLIVQLHATDYIRIKLEKIPTEPVQLKAHKVKSWYSVSPEYNPHLIWRTYIPLRISSSLRATDATIIMVKPIKE